MKIKSRFTDAPMGAKPWQIFVLCLLYVGLLGIIDFFLPYESSFSVFYLIPIIMASWYARKWYAITICVISATVQMWGNVMSGHVYASKWVIPWNMTVRLTFFIVVALLMVAVKDHLKREEMLSHTDTLTGINNLRAFNKWLDYHISIADRQGNSLALAYIDLDEFKALNDTKGHSTGDKALKAIGCVLRSGLRSTDIVGRLGGDEFAVLIPGIELRYVSVVFDRIFKRLNEEMRRNSWDVGFSIGVAVFLKPPRTRDEALMAADALMYKVKRGEKNSVMYRVIEGQIENRSSLPFQEDNQ